MQDTLIYWPIRTLDRTKTTPFPLEQRIWYLEWDAAPVSVWQEILIILKLDADQSAIPDNNAKPGDSETTLSFQGDDQSLKKMVAYRKYFRQRPGFDIATCLQEPGTPLKRIIPINLIEYFEDETGKAITKIDIYKFKTGEEYPIIPFDPRSVLRLGPSPVHPERPATQDISELIAHFLETVTYIVYSPWNVSPTSLTLRTFDNNTEIDSDFPGIFETQGVLLAFRQLYASDALFNKAVNAYMRICGEQKKVEWMRQIKDAFNKYVDTPDVYPVMTGMTVREFLDLFLYGSKIAHSNERAHQEKFRSIITSHGRAKVIMAVHSGFHQLMDYAARALPVVKQDYQSWLTTGKCPKPSNLAIHELLSSSKGEKTSSTNTKSTQ